MFAHRLQVYPLHSTVTLEEQNGVFLVPVPGYRKVKFTLKSLPCVGFEWMWWYYMTQIPAVCIYRLFSPQTSQRVLSQCPTLNTVVVYFYTRPLELLRSSHSEKYKLCVLCVMQWLTSALCVSWFAIKKPITAVSVSPGHPRPVAISVEVLPMWADVQWHR